MSEHYRFFDSIDGEDERFYTADEFAEYFRQVISTGILNGGDNLRVTTTGTDMTVQINEGYAWIQGYLYKIDTEPLSLKVEGADPVLNRIDRIVIRLDKSLEKRYVKAFILKGEAGENPTAPILTRNENIYEISLGQVEIIAGKSYLEESEIIDERFNGEVCGLVNSLIEIDADHLIKAFEDNSKDLIELFKNQWQDWFDSIQGESYALNKDFIPVKKIATNLVFEVANLKLFQEATQRIENGIIFGDSFIGYPMNCSLKNSLTSLIRKRNEGLVFPVLDDIYENPKEESYLSSGNVSANYTSKPFSTYADGGGVQIYREAGIVLSDKYNLTHAQSVEIDWEVSTPQGTSNTNNFLLVNYEKDGKVSDSIKSIMGGASGRKTQFFDVSDLTGEFYIGMHSRALGSRTAQAKMYGLKIIYSENVHNQAIAVYDLPETDEVVVFVKIEGDFNINAYANNQPMTKEIGGNEKQFHIKLSEKSPVELRIEVNRETINETDKITRILGGIAK